MTYNTLNKVLPMSNKNCGKDQMIVPCKESKSNVNKVLPKSNKNYSKDQLMITPCKESKSNEGTITPLLSLVYNSLCFS